jgi:hypothetical protein
MTPAESVSKGYEPQPVSNGLVRKRTVFMGKSIPGVGKVLAGLAAILVVAGGAAPVHAIKQFYAELEARYVKPDSQERNDVALIVAFEQARCTICHPGDDKRKLTRYGGQLALRIGKFDKDDKQKIRDAFDEVGSLRSDPYEPGSPTYEQLFRQGKLPPGPRP